MNSVSTKPSKLGYCPCNHGTNCIVIKRNLCIWMHEDNLFKENRLPIRKNCFSKYSIEQHRILRKYLW